MSISHCFAPFLIVLLEKLASGELLEFLRRLGIDAQLKEWCTTLLMIQAVLTDAENKQRSNADVHERLMDLESLVYKLDALVDKFITKASLDKSRENEGSTSKVWKLIPTCRTNISVDNSMLDRRTASKIKNISSKLEGLSKRISTLSLVENVRGRPYGTGERFQIASFTEESEVVSEAYSLS
ncbi:unnamed protein product [Fraxinus pennsylvanica]|uniref:Disease resistance N-terminal domain-containing protein n=1 Tax=Fraxinus pennsylvanica TaxID=56036 RepID=A0AAD2AIY9_9LAMI|nr:unnamed protein product [Fraxinus pennsylvanica]